MNSNRIYQSLVQSKGTFVTNAGPKGRDIGYAFHIGGGTIDLTVMEIADMIEAIEMATEETWDNLVRSESRNV